MSKSEKNYNKKQLIVCVCWVFCVWESVRADWNVLTWQCSEQNWDWLNLLVFVQRSINWKKRFCSSSSSRSNSSNNKVFVSSFLSAVICCCSGVCPICCVRNTLVHSIYVYSYKWVCVCVCVYMRVLSRFFLVQFRLFCPCRDLLYSITVVITYTQTQSILCGSS